MGGFIGDGGGVLELGAGSQTDGRTAHPYLRVNETNVMGEGSWKTILAGFWEDGGCL